MTILTDFGVYSGKELLCLLLGKTIASLPEGGTSQHMSNMTQSPLPARNSLPWLIVCALSLLAWIATVYQTWHMLILANPLFGTMGLTLWPFLGSWTVMMIAMMFPALAPTIATRYHQSQQNAQIYIFGRMLVFLLGYLAAWVAFGVPTFFLARLGEYVALHTPAPGIGLGIILLVVIGLYQMTPLEKRSLAHCNPSLCCSVPQTSSPMYTQLGAGLKHGLYCLGCCGSLMLVMVAVGLMNLPWMILLTLIIFLEKTWKQGIRLSFFVGFSLLIFAVLALAEPALLAGLYRPV